MEDKILAISNSINEFKELKKRVSISKSDADNMSFAILSVLIDIKTELQELKKPVKVEDKIEIELEELNKTQLLKHLERKEIVLENVEKLTKEEIVEKLKVGE